MLSDAQWAELEPLVEACRPKAKTPPQNLRHAHADELLLPAVKGRLGHAHLPADLVHRRTILRLPQSESDLFIREAFARHGILPPSGLRCPKNLRSARTSLLGQGH